jgi:hypothetical protein
MDAITRRAVRQRANDRCEYCQLPQFAVAATFHQEHVIPRQHGGGDEIENLALSCDRCNLTKGPNLSSIDPVTRTIVPLFNPRSESWDAHFELVGAEIVGLTPTGRATAGLLQMNATHRRHLRSILIAAGEL